MYLKLTYHILLYPKGKNAKNPASQSTWTKKKQIFEDLQGIQKKTFHLSTGTLRPRNAWFSGKKTN